MSAFASNLDEWTARVVGEEIARVDEALSRQLDKPRSGKRVHDARRALARLRSTLQDFQSCIDDAAPLLERVGTLHKHLGRIRDADVHIERLRAYRKSATPQERATIREVSRVIRKRRRKARRKLAELLAVPHVVAAA